MVQSCRDEINRLWKDDALPDGIANAALIRDKFLRVDVKDNDFSSTKKGLYIAMYNAVDLSAIPYKAAFERYVSALGTTCEHAQFRTRGRMVLGLGSESVLETGITLQHTYGVPVIPGSALKGLASHYCHQVWGAEDARGAFRIGGNYHNALFGTNDDSGHITFHDAWIAPEAAKDSLQLDIMTPHHPEYYKGNGAPTDFDDPIPLPFVSISGTFHVAVSCDMPDPNGKKWQVLAFQLLADALGNWGIGGKTSAGYGRMVKQEGGILQKKTGLTSRLSIAGKPYPSGEMKSEFKKPAHNSSLPNKHGQRSDYSRKRG